MTLLLINKNTAPKTRLFSMEELKKSRSRWDPRFAREIVFGAAHIYASFNDTFIYLTGMSGKETISRVTGGMKVKASSYVARLTAQDVAEKCKLLGITTLHIKLLTIGGKTPGPYTQFVLRALARSSMKIGRIEDITPILLDSIHRKGDHRGCRL